MQNCRIRQYLPEGAQGRVRKIKVQGAIFTASRLEDFLRVLEKHGDAFLMQPGISARSVRTRTKSARWGLAQSVPEKVARLLLEWAYDGELN